MRELSPSLRVPGGKDSLKFLGDETAIIDLDGGPGNALGYNCVCQRGEGQLVGEEGISPVPKQPETLCDPITVPKSESDRVISRRMEDVDEFGQGLERG